MKPGAERDRHDLRAACVGSTPDDEGAHAVAAAQVLLRDHLVRLQAPFDRPLSTMMSPLSRRLTVPTKILSPRDRKSLSSARARRRGSSAGCGLDGAETASRSIHALLARNRIHQHQQFAVHRPTSVNFFVRARPRRRVAWLRRRRPCAAALEIDHRHQPGLAHFVSENPVPDRLAVVEDEAPAATVRPRLQAAAEDVSAAPSEGQLRQPSADFRAGGGA